MKNSKRANSHHLGTLLLDNLDYYSTTPYVVPIGHVSIPTNVIVNYIMTCLPVGLVLVYTMAVPNINVLHLLFSYLLQSYLIFTVFTFIITLSLQMTCLRNVWISDFKLATIYGYYGSLGATCTLVLEIMTMLNCIVTTLYLLTFLLII